MEYDDNLEKMRSNPRILRETRESSYAGRDCPSKGSTTDAEHSQRGEIRQPVSQTTAE